jgi:hypothetical protein
MICMLQISQVFPPALPIPNQSALPSLLPTYCSDCRRTAVCTVRGSHYVRNYLHLPLTVTTPRCVTISQQRLFTAYCHHPTLCHHITATSIYRLLSPPHVVSPYHSNKTYCHPSVTQNLFSWNVLVCVADSSGLIWKSPHEGFLWYWVANFATGWFLPEKEL